MNQVFSKVNLFKWLGCQFFLEKKQQGKWIATNLQWLMLNLFPLLSKFHYNDIYWLIICQLKNCTFKGIAQSVTFCISNSIFGNAYTEFSLFIQHIFWNHQLIINLIYNSFLLIVVLIAFLLHPENFQRRTSSSSTLHGQIWWWEKNHCILCQKAMVSIWQLLSKFPVLKKGSGATLACLYRS